MEGFLAIKCVLIVFLEPILMVIGFVHQISLKPRFSLYNNHLNFCKPRENSQWLFCSLKSVKCCVSIFLMYKYLFLKTLFCIYRFLDFEVQKSAPNYIKKLPMFGDFLFSGNIQGMYTLHCTVIQSLLIKSRNLLEMEVMPPFMAHHVKFS